MARAIEELKQSTLFPVKVTILVIFEPFKAYYVCCSGRRDSNRYIERIPNAIEGEAVLTRVVALTPTQDSHTN